MSADASVRIGFSYSLGGTVSSPNPVELVRAEPLETTWDPVERWLRKKKPVTQYSYKLYFNRFLDWASTRLGFDDPRGFLAWAKYQQEGIAVEEALESFVETQKRSCHAEAMSAIKTFLERNGYKELPKGMVQAYRGQHIEGYSREQIIQLLSYLDDPLQKLFILFQKDIGYRARTTLSLKWHHVKPDFEKTRDYCHLYLEEEYYQGRKTAGIGFIGPDSLWLLRELVQQGRVTPNLETCNTGGPDRAKWRCKCQPIFPFHYKTITEIIKRAKKKAGLPEKIQPTHGLRKFFENALDKCEPSLDVDKKRQLEGHSLGVRWNYTDQLESLRPLYARAYPHLTLSEDAVADRKVKALLDEVRALRSDNARLHNLEERLRRLENAEGIVSIDGKKLIVGQPSEALQPIELGGA